VTVAEDRLREQAKRAEPWLVRLGPPLPGALTTEVGATPVDTSPGKESVASAAETGATEVAKPGPRDEQGVGRAARRTTIARATEVERASATEVEGAMEVDLEGDSDRTGHRCQKPRRSDPQKPPRSAVHDGGVAQGVPTDKVLRDALLREVRRTGDTATRDDVVVWARMQDIFRQRGLSWADTVIGFRAWEVRRGVIRIFASGRSP